MMMGSIVEAPDSGREQGAAPAAPDDSPEPPGEVLDARIAPSLADEVLRTVFGHGALRAGQDDAIAAVLAGRDAAVLLPTGAGKSLCYQVPAVAAARAGRGTTIVVSPLIALMDDQVAALTGRGVAAAALHSHQDGAARRATLAAFVAGELALLYVSPERAALASFRRLLARAPVALLAIDEAHCLSQWGHDFRPEYLQLHELRDVVDAPAIALTATATPRVMDEIVSALGLRQPAVVRGDFRRPNLRFAVEHHAGDASRIAAVIAACDAAGLRARHGPGRAIVYCATRKKTELVAEALRSAGFPAAHYHAGRTALARSRAQQAFALARTRVLVATNAFGMGIDYADVRLIVHFQSPGSLEAYYQEAGRAGRDGDPATCLMLFGPADLVTQRRLAEGRSETTALRAEQALAAVERYARAARCRQVMLCAHFTGRDAHDACGQCDACCDPARVATDAPAREVFAPLGDDARQVIVDAVGALARPAGRTRLARMLRASLPGATEAELLATIDALIDDRRLVRRGRRFPTVTVPGGASPRATARAPRRRRDGGDVARELDRYRRQKARELRWKAYMVLQRRVIAAIDEQRPGSREALARIPGLGPAKIERFGDDILAVVRRHHGDGGASR
jgi:ATP-dependent DNA helicase RecQ